MSLKSRLLNKSAKLKKELNLTELPKIIEAPSISRDKDFNIVEYFENHQDFDALYIYAHDKIYAEKNGVLEELELFFKDDDEIRRIINLLAADYDVIINSQTPSFSVSLGNKIKINAIIPPMIEKGAYLSFRRVVGQSYSNILLNENKFISNEIILFLKECITKNLNIFIAGDAKSNKTAVLNYILNLIPKDESVVTIEAVSELKIKNKAAIRLVKYKNAFAKLIKKAVNLKQDRIVVSNANITELTSLYENIVSGTNGFMASFSVKSYDDFVPSLQNMILLNNPNFTAENANSLISSAIDIVVFVESSQDGNHRITRIAEFSNQKNDIKLQDIFFWKKSRIKTKKGDGNHASCGIKSKFFDADNFYTQGFLEEYLAKEHKHSYLTKPEKEVKSRKPVLSESEKVQKQIAKYKSLKDKLKKHS